MKNIPAKFPKVWCSQCGRSFGPGNHGYSHCEDHALPNVAEIEKRLQAAHWQLQRLK